MDEVLQQIEHEARAVQGLIAFRTLDVLDYLRQEAAQPNDHDQRLLIGDSGLSSPDGLALLLSSIIGAEMERDQACRGQASFLQGCLDSAKFVQHASWEAYS